MNGSMNLNRSIGTILPPGALSAIDELQIYKVRAFVCRLQSSPESEKLDQYLYGKHRFDYKDQLISSDSF